MRPSNFRLAVDSVPYSAPEAKADAPHYPNLSAPQIRQLRDIHLPQISAHIESALVRQLADSASPPNPLS
jgi:hypothetical protein